MRPAAAAALCLPLLPAGAAAAEWTQVSAQAPWHARTQAAVHSTLSGRLYVIGGRTTSFFGDVWASDDGATWEEISNKSTNTWLPRAYHQVVEVNGSLIMMGGAKTATKFVSDVWRSDDAGRTWSQVTDSAPWGVTPAGDVKGRGGHFVAVMGNGSMILTGGNWAEFSGKTYYGDVWRSDDKGATWVSVAATAGWFPRVAQQLLLMPDGALVLVGGDNFRLGNYTAAHDVWRSDDWGATWTYVADTPFAPRSGQKCALLGGDIVCVGGITGIPLNGTAGDSCPHKSSCKLHDVWRSADAGATWAEVPAPAWGCAADDGNCGRFDFGIAVKDGGIYTIAGDEETGLPFPQDNSVWKLTL